MVTLHYQGKSSARLDTWLRARYPHLSVGRWHKALREGKIKLNGKKPVLSARIEPGDEVALYLPDTELTAPSPKILYEDEGMLVALKPPGLPTLGEEDSLLSRLTGLPGMRLLPGGFPAPCHRLDTGTGGLVMFAKNPDALTCIEGMQRRQEIHKTYLCVVLGTPGKPAATLQGWHTKDSRRGIVHISTGPVAGAKPVTTRYQTLHSTDGLSLLEVELVTGRTHQIRAHLAAAGTPILGDSKYGDLRANRAYRCRYQCLCAWRLAFPASSPLPTWNGLTVEAPLPWYYTTLLEGTLTPKQGSGGRKGGRP